MEKETKNQLKESYIQILENLIKKETKNLRYLERINDTQKFERVNYYVLGLRESLEIFKKNQNRDKLSQNEMDIQYCAVCKEEVFDDDQDYTTTECSTLIVHSDCKDSDKFLELEMHYKFYD